MPNWLFGLFFLSGASALIYELIWQRVLTLVFGVSTLAVSAVLAAFMGGLALGGLIFGRHADRTSRPLRLYAWLEAGIAVSALLVPAGFSLMTVVYTSLYAWLQPGLWGGACIRFVLALIVLLIPATLIGGTMPVMGRLISRRGRSSPVPFSLLYGINTLGAVMGAVLTGFVLLRALGMQQTLLAAVACNLVVAVAAALATRYSASRDRQGAVTTCPPLPYGRGSQSLCAVDAKGRNGWTLVCAALTGIAAMGLEVAWTRILGIFTSNSAYAFALVLGVMLLGLCIGSLYQAMWSRIPGDGWRRLAICQWLLSALTLASLPLFRSPPVWLEQWSDGTSAARLFIAELALTAGALFLPAIFMGMSLPLLVAPWSGDGRCFGRWLGRVYAVNTLGGAGGAFLAGFVLIPALGIQATVEVFVVGSTIVGAIAWSWTSGRLPWRWLAPVGVLLATGIGVAVLPKTGYYKSLVVAPRRLLYYREGNNGTVSVVQERDGVRSILVDGQPVAGTAGTSVIDQKMLAHLPLLLHPNPRRALTVGFGSGGTSYSMTLHGIDVDCVEIERAVPAAAAHFDSENHGILAHPRFHLILDDARSWLRVAPVRYDAIVTDCTNVQYKSNGDLYTVDYFRLMKERLTDRGIAAAWVPANGIDSADLKTLLRSYQKVFPHTSVWFMNTLPTDFLIVIGTPQTLAIDMASWQARLSVPGVREDLASIGLDDPCRLAYTFLTLDARLAAYLGEGPLNVDDRPILSYSTYGATFRSTIALNLVELLSCREDVASYVRGLPRPETMLRHYAASNEAVMGHVCFQNGEGREALLHYVKGCKFLENDPALRYLVLMSCLGARRHPQ